MKPTVGWGVDGWTAERSTAGIRTHRESVTDGAVRAGGRAHTNGPSAFRDERARVRRVFVCENYEILGVAAAVAAAMFCRAQSDGGAHRECMCVCCVGSVLVVLGANGKDYLIAFFCWDACVRVGVALNTHWKG